MDVAVRVVEFARLVFDIVVNFIGFQMSPGVSERHEAVCLKLARRAVECDLLCRHLHITVRYFHLPRQTI